jgi:hypothetical protein
MADDMRIVMERLILSALLLVSVSPLAAQQPPQLRPAVSVDAITGIVEAFRSHNVVAISDAHGNVGAQDFLISLVRDRRFTDVVDDVVVEWGNSRYQDVIDRFVNGEDGLLDK